MSTSDGASADLLLLKEHEELKSRYEVLKGRSVTLFKEFKEQGTVVERLRVELEEGSTTVAALKLERDGLRQERDTLALILKDSEAKLTVNKAETVACNATIQDLETRLAAALEAAASSAARERESTTANTAAAAVAAAAATAASRAAVDTASSEFNARVASLESELSEAKASAAAAAQSHDDELRGLKERAAAGISKLKTARDTAREQVEVMKKEIEHLNKAPALPVRLMPFFRITFPEAMITELEQRLAAYLPVDSTVASNDVPVAGNEGSAATIVEKTASDSTPDATRPLTSPPPLPRDWTLALQWSQNGTAAPAWFDLKRWGELITTENVPILPLDSLVASSSSNAGGSSLSLESIAVKTFLHDTPSASSSQTSTAAVESSDTAISKASLPAPSQSYFLAILNAREKKQAASLLSHTQRITELEGQLDALLGEFSQYKTKAAFALSNSAKSQAAATATAAVAAASAAATAATAQSLPSLSAPHAAARNGLKVDDATSSGYLVSSVSDEEFETLRASERMLQERLSVARASASEAEAQAKQATATSIQLGEEVRLLQYSLDEREARIVVLEKREADSDGRIRESIEAAVMEERNSASERAAELAREHAAEVEHLNAELIERAGVVSSLLIDISRLEDIAYRLQGEVQDISAAADANTAAAVYASETDSSGSIFERNGARGEQYASQQQSTSSYSSPATISSSIAGGSAASGITPPMGISVLERILFEPAQVPSTTAEAAIEAGNLAVGIVTVQAAKKYSETESTLSITLRERMNAVLQELNESKNANASVLDELADSQREAKRSSAQLALLKDTIREMEGELERLKTFGGGIRVTMDQTSSILPAIPPPRRVSSFNVPPNGEAEGAASLPSADSSYLRNSTPNDNDPVAGVTSSESASFSLPVSSVSPLRQDVAAYGGAIVEGIPTSLSPQQGEKGAAPLRNHETSRNVSSPTPATSPAVSFPDASNSSSSSSVQSLSLSSTALSPSSLQTSPPTSKTPPPSITTNTARAVGSSAPSTIASHTDAATNLQYLKNAIVAYLCSGSADERRGMLPAISLLLRLSIEEQKRVLQQLDVEASASNSLWGMFGSPGRR